jgi:hypothetical protein
MVAGVWGKEDLLDLAGQRGLTGGDDGEMNTDICASLLGRIKSRLFRNLREFLQLAVVCYRFSGEQHVFQNMYSRKKLMESGREKILPD